MTPVILEHKVRVPTDDRRVVIAAVVYGEVDLIDAHVESMIDQPFTLTRVSVSLTRPSAEDLECMYLSPQNGCHANLARRGKSVASEGGARMRPDDRVVLDVEGTSAEEFAEFRILLTYQTKSELAEIWPVDS